MQNFWYDFLKYISSVAIVATALGWVARRLIDNFFSKKIEEYKAQLEKENTKYKITYEKLHAERANVIKETYKKLIDVHDGLKSYMIKKDQKDLEDLLVNLCNFNKYYDQNRIFLNEALAKKLDQIRDFCWGIYGNFGASVVMEKMKDYMAANKEYLKGIKKFMDDFPSLRENIEKEFRTLIGIE